MRHRFSAAIFSVALLLAVLSASGSAWGADEPTLHRAENLTSYVFHFGGGGGEKAVTPEAMRAFIEEVIVPRFPTGTSVYESMGQWQNPETGEIFRERSYILSLECYPDPANRAKIDEIAREYLHKYKEAGVSCFLKIFPGVTTELHYFEK